jgi:hypothetical protein
LHNSEVLEEGEERVGWPVASGVDVGWCGSVEGLLFDGEVAVHVDVGGLELFVAEPEGENGTVDS